MTNEDLAHSYLQAKRIENIDPSTSSGRTGYVKLCMRHYTSAHITVSRLAGGSSKVYVPPQKYLLGIDLM